MSLTGDYTLPTAALFKMRYPHFSPVSDDLIDFIITEAITNHMNDRWIAAHYQQAILLFAAHSLTMEGEPERSIAIYSNANAGAIPATGNANDVISEAKVDDVHVKIDTNAGGRTVPDATTFRNLTGDALEFSTTHYGRQFLRLRQLSFGGPRVSAI